MAVDASKLIEILDHVDEKHLGEDEVTLACVGVSVAVIMALDMWSVPELAHQEGTIDPLSMVVQTALMMAAMEPEWVRRMCLEANYERHEQVEHQMKGIRQLADILKARYVPRVPGDDAVEKPREGI